MTQLDPEKLVELAGRIRSIGDRIGTINRMSLRVDGDIDDPLASLIFRLASDLCGIYFDGYASTELSPLFAGFIRAGLQAESDRLRAEMAEVAREIGGAAQPPFSTLPEQTTRLPDGWFPLPTHPCGAAESAAADALNIPASKLETTSAEANLSAAVIPAAWAPPAWTTHTAKAAESLAVPNGPGKTTVRT